MTNPPLRVLITGATGFVGRALVRSMANAPDFDVIAAVRNERDVNKAAAAEIPALPAGSGDHAGAHLKHFAVGDISANTDWSSALDGVDAIVHLAARVHVMKEIAADPVTAFRRVNVEGTINLARQAASRGVKRFVFLSSVKANGDSGTLTERDTPTPVDSYGITKLEAETALRAVSRDTGMEVVIVRPPLVYGPGVRANFRSLISLVRSGIPLPFGAVQNRRSFVAVDNLVSFLITCVQHPHAAGETFLISDGHDLSTPELLQHIGNAMGVRVRLFSMPHWMLKGALNAFGRKAVAERLLGSLCVDIGKARTLLQWIPPVDVAEALRRTVIDK